MDNLGIYSFGKFHKFVVFFGQWAETLLNNEEAQLWQVTSMAPPVYKPTWFYQNQNSFSKFIWHVHVEYAYCILT